MDSKINFKVISLLILVSVVIILEIAQIFGLNLKSNQDPNQTSTIPSTSPVGSKLITSQNATILGRILKLNNDTVTVENEDKVTGEVPLSKIVLINTIDKFEIASNSADFQKIELNKPVQINLVLINGTYTVSSITYLR